MELNRKLTDIELVYVLKTLKNFYNKVSNFEQTELPMINEYGGKGLSIEISIKDFHDK